MAKYKILVVEDDSLAGEDLRFQLEHLGYQVPAIEPSAFRALKAVDKHQPDLVLMDIFLEGDVDGIQAAAQIQERWDVPIIFMSIYSDKDVLERAKITQPFGYIVKPYTERELQAVLSMALYRAEAEKKIHESVWMTNTLDAMGAALIHTDNTGHVRTMNGFAETLLRVPLASLQGRWLPDQVDLQDGDGGRPLAGFLKEVLDGHASWIRKRDLFLTPAGEESQSVDLTIRASLGRDGSRGADVLLQVNDSRLLQRKTAPATEQMLERPVNTSPARSLNASSDIDAFIGTVSHDLRAPLQELGRFNRALQDDAEKYAEERVGDYADRAQQAVQRMQQVIRNLVIYMRLGRGQLTLGDVDLGEAVSDSLEQLFVSRDVIGTVEINRPLPVVRAHAATLVRLLTQLFANALHFVPDGAAPKVRMSAESAGRQVRICIDNQGEGLTPSPDESPFRLFWRAHHDNVCPGAGIGLAIVHRAAAWMGGRAEYEQNHNGVNRFRVELPAV